MVDVMVIIVMLISSILSASLIFCSILFIMKYFNSQKNLMEFQKRIAALDEKNKELEDELKKKSIEYSTDLMNYLRDIIGQISVLKFKSFQDGHEMKMVSKGNIESLISDICKTVHSSINESNVVFEDMMFTEEFYNQYIVETTIIIVKDMLEKLEESQY